MPQPIVIEYGQGLSRGIEQAGSAIGGALMKRTEEKKKKEALSPFERVMKDSQDPQQPRLTVPDAYNMAIKQGADPQTATAMASMLIQQQQQNAFASGMDAALDFEGGIDSPEGKNAFLTSYSRAGGDFKTIAKLIGTQKRGSQTAEQKVIGKAKADAVLSVAQGGGNSKEIYDNLQWLEKNIKNVGATKGLLNYGPMQSSLFSEYQNRGNLVLSPVIHIFNKAGTLPQKKLEWIREQFAISPYETQAKITGRINAIKPLVSAAMEYQAKISDLTEKYGEPDNIPNKEFLSASKEMNNKVDSFFNKQFKQETFSKPPDAKKMAGKTITNPETGEKLRSNGSKWIKIG